jgi:phosphatidylglycerol:prolipoprotein diacylglycerol transferase
VLYIHIMRTTLLVIPHELAGIPVFGFGWLLIAWVLICAAMLAFLIRRQGWNKDTASYLPFQLFVALFIVLLMPRLELVTDKGVPLGLPIRGFGIMMALATVAGVGLALHRAQKMGVDPDAIMSLAMWMFIPGIIGARLFFVIEYWDQFARPTLEQTLVALLNVTNGGLVMYGSVVGGLPFGIYYLVSRKLPVLAIADIIAPSMVVGLALGRIGCFLNGCCYGGLCEGPLAVTFPGEPAYTGAPASPPYEKHHELGWLYGLRLATDEQGVVIRRVDPGSAAAAAGVQPGEHVAAIGGRKILKPIDAFKLLGKSGQKFLLTTQEGNAYLIAAQVWPGRSLPVHPTQLYASLDAALLAAFLWFYYPFRRRDGEVFALLVTLHPISRFLLEIIRDDEPGFLGTSLTIAQWTSAAIFFAAIGLWWYLARQPQTRALPPKWAAAQSQAAWRLPRRSASG